MKRRTEERDSTASHRLNAPSTTHDHKSLLELMVMEQKIKGVVSKQTMERSLLPIGTVIDIIGGVYVGQQATILGYTPKMYNVKLTEGRVTVIKQRNAREVNISPGLAQCPTGAGVYRELIELEMQNIRGSLQNITTLLDRMSLEQHKSDLVDKEK